MDSELVILSRKDGDFQVFVEAGFRPGKCRNQTKVNIDGLGFRDWSAE